MVAGALPRPLTEFFGREDDIRAVLEALATRRLVTLVGPGGVGKTRLAVEASHAIAGTYAGGCWFVDLSALRDGAHVASTILSSLAHTEGRDLPLDALVDAIGERSLLLVLDNCEQVVEGVAAVGARLLEACPGLRVLATSREPLALGGENVIRVAPFSLPEAARAPDVAALLQLPAIRLFVDRARLANSEFTLTPDNARTVLVICSAVDGLPLATELAAAHVRTLAVEQIAGRLQQRLPMLSGGGRSAPDRQRTMEGALRWSHELLSEPEQILFRRLAVFSGGWTLEAAEGICGFGDLPEDAIFRLLEGLVDRSLVVATPGGDGRFRFLEVIHEFARNELLASGEAEAVGARHCRWFHELTDAAEPHLDSRSALYWLDLLEADVENLWAALAWAVSDPRSAETGLRLAGNLSVFWNNRGHLAEGCAAARALLNAHPTAAPGARLAALVPVIWATTFTLFRSEAEAAAAEAIEIARELDDHRTLSKALYGGGLNRLFGGDIVGARKWTEEAVVVARRGALRLDLGFALSAMEMVLMETGDPEAAVAALDEALEIAHQDGYPRLEAILNVSRGEYARSHGDLREAQRAYERARDIATGLRIGRMESLATLNLAATAIQRDDFLVAVAALRQLLSGKGALDARLGILAVGLAGAVQAAAGDPWRATRWLTSLEGIHIDATDRPIIEAALQHCRERLGAEFEAAHCDGGADPRRFLEEVAQVLAATENGAVPPSGPLARLSAREVEIVRLVAEGKTNHDIAERLVLSRRTVETHIANAYAKIGAHNRAEAVRFALDKGLLSPAPA